jgi:hypothetical protein
MYLVIIAFTSNGLSSGSLVFIDLISLIDVYNWLLLSSNEYNCSSSLYELCLSSFSFIVLSIAISSTFFSSSLEGCSLTSIVLLSAEFNITSCDENTESDNLELTLIYVLISVSITLSPVAKYRL